MLESGDVYSWGLGEFGALGTGDTFTRYSPFKLEYFQTNKVKVVSVSCGHKHSIFVSRTVFLFVTPPRDRSCVWIRIE